MIEINWSDVWSTLYSLRYYFIVMGAAIVLGIIAIAAFAKLPNKETKFLARSETGIAMLLVIVIAINLICTGPMSTLLNLVSGGNTEGDGTLTTETAQAAVLRVEEIADEGIVLLQNDQNLLPLSDGGNLNVFGWASTNPIYGGTGSGSMNDNYPIVSLLEGLANAGFTTNTELSDFYTSYRADRPAVGMWAQEWTLPEPEVSRYTDAMLSNAKAFSDTALIVFGRPGGEHIDLPQDLTEINSTEGAYIQNSASYVDFPAGTHYLELSQSERNLVELVCSNFDKVVIICNSSNTMDLSFVDDYTQIKSVLWCPAAGQNGFNSLGRILRGTVNPSGKAADTFIKDFTQAPWWNNFGYNIYENMDEFAAPADDQFVPGAPVHFVNYVEGIYVGYKYFETAATEGFIDYGSLVQYPFGHGLSYTTFTQEMGSISENGGVISFSVRVTNTGSVAGKDVVEVYYNPPYTNGGIEKASANLVAFDKTDLLQPGTSQDITIRFNLEDMASYDMRGNGRYVLEAGDYIISINSDSHSVIASQTYTVSADVDYSQGRSTDRTAASNQFDFADGGLTYLSRADSFANFAAATAAPSHQMSAADKAVFVNNSNYVIPTDPNAVMPTTGANNGMMVSELRGASYDDPRWETLLDNLTIADMNNMISLGGYQTPAVESIGKIATIDCDGPAALNNNFTGVGSVGFPSAVIIASTWSESLARAFGDGIADMAEDMNVSGWYAPAMNIHRTPFAGRNFEYYSEDAVLSGRIASGAADAASARGVYPYLKHFALNDQETGRWEMLTTWSTEQAIREIYLKPFELCVKDNIASGGASAGHPMAIMSSYNYIGTQWAGACSSLLNTVLRDEWGFRGSVLTDYFANFGYMDATRAIYNGGSSCLMNRDMVTNNVTNTANPLTVQMMRQACKDVLYTGVNSRGHALGAVSGGLMSWQIILIAVDVVLAAAVIALEVLIVRAYLSKKKSAAK